MFACCLTTLRTQNPGILWFVMDIAEGGTLTERLKRPKPSDAVTWRWWRDMAAGVAFLHRSNFIHRDIKVRGGGGGGALCRIRAALVN